MSTDSFGRNLKNTLISGPVNLAKNYSPKNIASSIKDGIDSLQNKTLGLVERGVNDFFNSPSLRDYTHASKVFVSNNLENAPKDKQLFHVHFSINRAFLPDNNPKSSPNFGLLVKTTDLPKFKIDTAKLNQYNRTKFVQTRIQYDPINIEFHDDGISAVSSLWYAYYTYMFGDGTVATNQQLHDSTLNKRNTYNPDRTGYDTWGLVGGQSITDNVVDEEKVPFFNYISIYGFNRGNFVEYRLVNPVIESFAHDSYDYGAVGVLSNRMSLQFETVQYYSGTVGNKQTNVEGFGGDSYDTTPSPLKTARTFEDGVADSAISVFNDPNASFIDKARAAAQTAATFRNPTNIVNTLLKSAENKVLGPEDSSGTRRNFNFKFPFGDNT